MTPADGQVAVGPDQVAVGRCFGSGGARLGSGGLGPGDGWMLPGGRGSNFSPLLADDPIFYHQAILTS